MPGRTISHIEEDIKEAHVYDTDMTESKRIPNRLILCFDGTGNQFIGNTSDTNIVKLYNKFDRSSPHQLHYYQPGIGTYTGDGSSINVGWFGKLKKAFSQTIDQGVATTFDAHVIAGYRFLMRYYGPDDRIYIFGFSRGAFTARFLARMVSQVGLLSMGNEEMVPFAYKLYQDYEMGLYNKKGVDYINNFKATFCRRGHSVGAPHSENEAGIKVHFLGLFDTVNSVGTLDVPFTKTMIPPKVNGTAEHIRHAVAVDERRVKFKVALLAQDYEGQPQEDVKEVWFPGNHGDVGGGWSAVHPEHTKQHRTFWQKIKAIFFAMEDDTPSSDVTKDPYQLSDIALKWMIDELDRIPGDHVQWNENKRGFLSHFHKRRKNAIKAPIHDTMKFGRGLSWGKVIFWNFMEYLPFIKRWEYIGSQWKYVTFPLNRGSTRDIPPGAKIHHSVLERMHIFKDYRPFNDVTVQGLDVTKPLKHIDLRFVDEYERNKHNQVRTHFEVCEEGFSETDNTYVVKVGPPS